MPKNNYWLALTIVAAAACAERPTGVTASCTSCDVELGSRLILSAPAEAEPSTAPRVRRDQHGRFYVAPLMDPFKIAVFAADGSFIRTVGRQGAGPGEFREIRDVRVGRGDTLYVLHDTNVTVFTPTFEFVRSTSSRAASMAGHLVILSDGTVVTGRSSTTYRAPPDDLIWIHGVDSSSVVPGGLPALDTATAAMYARETDLWLVRDDYRLYRKALDGEWVTVTERPLWFAEDGLVAPREERRPPYVKDLVVDNDHRIWIFSFTFSKREAPSTPTGGEERVRQSSVSEMRSYVHPRLDMWNSDGSLYMTAQLPDGASSFVDADHLVVMEEDSAGNTIINISRFNVRNR